MTDHAYKEQEDTPKVPAADEADVMLRVADAFLMRAEWLGDHLFDFFRAPSFFPQLESAQTCLLMGGRGTGKTTLLQSLSYEGRYALSGRSDASVAASAYYGIYLKVNTNRVTAFDGSEVAPTRWTKIFAHYLNLELVALVTDFFAWYEERTGTALLPVEDVWQDLSITFGVAECSTLATFRKALHKARLRFERQVNNIGDGSADMSLSMLGAPLDLVCSHLAKSPHFAGKRLFFLIDEYENLLDYQQQVFNTIIKHATSTYTFKVGVKELGFRVRSTINPTEQLNSPADYQIFDIAERLRPRFQAFAEQVCNSRLRTALGAPDGRSAAYPALMSMTTLFPGLNDEREAQLLGVTDRTRQLQRTFEKERVSERLASHFAELTPLRQYFCYFRAASGKRAVSSVIEAHLRDPERWERDFNNYKLALLFSLRRGQPGRRKFYAGWSLMCKLASGNIRYLLELVVGALSTHVERGREFGRPVSPEIQTDAAQAIGKKNLQELDGRSVHGASLTKLLLGMGRVLGLLAAHPEGHAPEITQFYVPYAGRVLDPALAPEQRVASLLNDAVDSLALLRFSGTKAQEQSDTQAYDYMIHPIFAAFFEVSHRRKRKLAVSERELLGLIDHPGWAINRLVARHNRDGVVEDVALPEQLRLFESFFGAHA